MNDEIEAELEALKSKDMICNKFYEVAHDDLKLVKVKELVTNGLEEKEKWTGLDQYWRQRHRFCVISGTLFFQVFSGSTETKEENFTGLASGAPGGQRHAGSGTG